AKTALYHGYKISKRKFWSMLLLGLVNFILGMIILGLPLLLISAIVLGGIFGIQAGYGLGIMLTGIGVILLIAFIFGSIFLSGILTAFKATIWTIAYNNIKGKYEK